jgi:hypothetical protein
MSYLRPFFHASEVGASRFLKQWRYDRLLVDGSADRVCSREHPGLEHGYFFTSERGIYRIDQRGVRHVFKVPTYGIAFSHDTVFLTCQVDDTSFIGTGRREDLAKASGRFGIELLVRQNILASNERFHGICAGDTAVWAANTQRNTLLRIDPVRLEVVAEIPVFLDRFDRPILYDVNHVNGVSEYHGTVLFTAYRAGGQSMIGMYDGNRITGFGYGNVGVHDIYFTDDDLWLGDTFGNNTEGTGGAVVTKNGILDRAYFEQPPGVIVRGIAGTKEELLIGHSHKGERRTRFSGHGAILIARNGKVAKRIEVEPAQVYQIIREDGRVVSPPPARLTADDIRRRLEGVFGSPLYEAGVSPYILES